METRVMVFLSGVVGLLGVMSAVLGFMAEAKKLTPADIRVFGTECVYPANPAYWLAIGAIFLLAASQIIASMARSCCGSYRPAGGDDASKKWSTRQVAGIIVSVLSWTTAVIAVVFYWIGAAWNAPQRRNVTFAGRNEECLYLKDGVFIRATVLSLIATSLAITSCILLRAPAATAEPEAGAAEFKPEGQYPSESGVVVGLPQWPAQGFGQAAYQQPAQATYGQTRV